MRTVAEPPRWLVVAALLALLAGAEPVRAAGFTGLGDLPGGIVSSEVYGLSGDGSTAVGVSRSSSGSEAFRWQGGVMQGLGDLSGGPFASEAFAASFDGSIVVGNGQVGTTDVHAFRWQGSMTDLGTGFLAGALDVSANGQIAVGVRGNGSVSDAELEAARWVNTSLSGLGDLSGGEFFSTAYAVSGDGGIVVGVSDDGSAPSAVGFRWESGSLTALHALAPGFTTLAARGISADGNVIVGEDDDPVAGERAFRLEGGSVTLLPGMRLANAVSGDGGVIAGTTGPVGATRAVVWDAVNGTRLVSDVLRDDFHVTAFEGWVLREAVAISDDGQFVAGNGTNPQGEPEAWLADLSPGCGDGADNDGDGLVDAADPGCDDPQDRTEHSPALVCDDFADNDGDGLADFPADPGCASVTDATETTPALVCDDGIDNDGDLGADVAGDPGCDDVNDPSERSAALVCDDGADNDGDGNADYPADLDCASPLDPSEDAIPGTVVLEQKISQTAGGFAGALADHEAFGAALAALGDLGGDGSQELAVGGPGDGSSADPGRLWLLSLYGGGPVAAELEIGAGQGGFAGALDAGDRFGAALAPLGDLDGDGVRDLAVGAPYDDDGGADRGAVWILFLNADGTVKAWQKLSDTAGGFGAPLASLALFGSSLAALDDLDGDGRTDLAVGAPGSPGGGFLRGAAFVLFLNADGTVKAWQEIGQGAGGFGGALDDFDFFATSLAAPGDVDGDGLADVAVGVPFDDDGGPDRGAVWLLFLNADGTVKAEQKISALAGGFSGALLDDDNFGTAAAGLGDLDADGVADLAVGAPLDDDGGEDRGAAWLLALQPDGTVKTWQKVSDLFGAFGGVLDDGDRFGGGLGAFGARLAVGAPRDDDGGAERGALWLLDVDRALCGDGVAEFGEICDDGNAVGLDGCSPLCLLEDAFALQGTALGGSVSLTVAGIEVLAATAPGQSAAAVLGALAAAIGAEPDLQAAGVTAAVESGVLVVQGGAVSGHSLDDPGLYLPEAAPIPALPPACWLALALAALACAARGARRGVCCADGFLLELDPSPVRPPQPLHDERVPR